MLAKLCGYRILMVSVNKQKKYISDGSIELQNPSIYSDFQRAGKR